MTTYDKLRCLTTAIVPSDNRVRGRFPSTALAVSVAFVLAAGHGVVGLFGGHVTAENIGYVAVGVLLAPGVLASKFRIDRDGIHHRTLLRGWRTTGWDEITTLTVTRGLKMTTPVQIHTRNGRTHTLYAAGGAAGCTRPLLLLAAAAEHGLIPGHVAVRIEPRPTWPEAARAVRRLEDASIPTTRT